jgi:hypothetical protein
MILLLGLSALLLAQIPLAPSQTGTATGMIRTTAGAPASGVRVAALALTDSTAGIGEGALVSLTQTDSEGRYKLENIPPGRYYIQAGLVDLPTYYPGVNTTNGARSIQITAGAVLDRMDFNLVVGAGVRVAGRVPLGVVRPALVRLTGGQVRGGPQMNTAQVQADGTFEFLRVPPGNYTLVATPANSLPNLTLVVTDKDIDVGVPAGPGVKVSGVVGLGPQSPRPANQKVVFTGATAWAQVETTVSRDGKFELPSVPAGTYSLRTVPGSLSAQSTVVIADREITGVAVPAYVELTGIVVLQDGQKLPSLSTALMIQAVPVKGATLATAIRSDGAFRFPIVEGEYRISMGKLPGGISVKSIQYGSTNLLSTPLKLDGSGELKEIRVTMESVK